MRGKRVYFDTNVFIYLIEGFAELRATLLDIRDSILHGEAEIVTSELTICEALVAPFRSNNSAHVAGYRRFIEESGAFELRPTSRETYVRASLYRAQMGLKTPGAIHVATALEAGCAVFVTNDRSIKAPARLRIVQLIPTPVD